MSAHNFLKGFICLALISCYCSFLVSVVCWYHFNGSTSSISWEQDSSHAQLADVAELCHLCVLRRKYLVDIQIMTQCLVQYITLCETILFLLFRYFKRWPEKNGFVLNDFVIILFPNSHPRNCEERKGKASCSKCLS